MVRATRRAAVIAAATIAALAGCGGSDGELTETEAQRVPLILGAVGLGCGLSHNAPSAKTRAAIDQDVDLLASIVRDKPDASLGLTRDGRSVTVRAAVDRLLPLLKRCAPAAARKLQAAEGS